MMGKEKVQLYHVHAVSVTSIINFGSHVLIFVCVNLTSSLHYLHVEGPLSVTFNMKKDLIYYI